MQIFDTHTHLNVENFEGKEKEEMELLKRLMKLVLQYY